MRGMIVVFATVLGAIQALALDRADRFENGFNKAAAKLGVSMRAGIPNCGSAICDYDLAPRGRLSIVYSGAAKSVDEIAAYFDPNPRGGLDAIDAAKILLAIVATDQPRPLRDAALQSLLKSATGDRRDGEVTLGRWRYVVRPSDGRDIRLYVRAADR